VNTYPEAGHRGAVVLVQQVAQVLNLALVNAQLLDHVSFNVLLDMARDPRAHRVQRVVEVCRQEQSQQSLLHSVKRQRRKQGNNRKKKERKKWTATFCRENK
jgi:hypothetical protein